MTELNLWCSAFNGNSGRSVGILYGVRNPLDVFLGIVRKRENVGTDRDILHW
jgi:hypothetical protein